MAAVPHSNHRELGARAQTRAPKGLPPSTASRFHQFPSIFLQLFEFSRRPSRGLFILGRRRWRRRRQAHVIHGPVARLVPKTSTEAPSSQAKTAPCAFSECSTAILARPPSAPLRGTPSAGVARGQIARPSPLAELSRHRTSAARRLKALRLLRCLCLWLRVRGHRVGCVRSVGSASSEHRGVLPIDR